MSYSAGGERRPARRRTDVDGVQAWGSAWAHYDNRAWIRAREGKSGCRDRRDGAGTASRRGGEKSGWAGRRRSKEDGGRQRRRGRRAGGSDHDDDGYGRRDKEAGGFGKGI
mmetsp:Transcript_33480/g.66141  ORF Transcript_33480/g.66141 Transcript_33480/m.66141 type:complete len:111 (-) Transcript_33480:564-896(-)